MALGKRSDEQQEMWVATTSLPKSQGHVFYRKLNQLLAETGFDRTVEEMCRPYYHSHLGRPSIPPGVYFRMLLVGYFEGIGSQRGIAWRCADSLSLREFLGIPLTEETPDHSSLTRVRDRLPLEVHTAVFQCGAEAGGREEADHRQDGGRRFHHAGGQRRHEVDRAAGYRRGLEGVSAASAARTGRCGKPYG